MMIAQHLIRFSILVYTCCWQLTLSKELIAEPVVEGPWASKWVVFQDVINSIVRSEDHPTPKHDQKLMVIGPGWGRTGTTSFAYAMKLLGFKPFDMIDGLVNTPGYNHLFFEEAMAYLENYGKELNNTGEYSSPAIDRIIDQMSNDGFSAVMDEPGNVLYPEMIRRYPEAYVVLTIRTGPNGAKKWADSWLATVGQVGLIGGRMLRLLPKNFKIYKAASIMRWFRKLQGLPDNTMEVLPTKEELVKCYHAWNDKVQEIVPAECLLVFDSTDGWEPLCKFLSQIDKQIARACDKILASHVPYPHLNDSSEFRIGLRVLLFLEACFILVLLASIVATAWSIAKILKTVLKNLSSNKGFQVEKED